jgi:hypothetical protein
MDTERPGRPAVGVPEMQKPILEPAAAKRQGTEIRSETSTTHLLKKPLTYPPTGPNIASVPKKGYSKVCGTIAKIGAIATPSPCVRRGVSETPAVTRPQRQGIGWRHHIGTGRTDRMQSQWPESSMGGQAGGTASFRDPLPPAISASAQHSNLLRHPLCGDLDARSGCK